MRERTGLGSQKMGIPKRGKGELGNRDTGWHRHGALKKALFIPLNNWLAEPTIMEKVGNAESPSKDFEEEQWGITNV